MNGKLSDLFGVDDGTGALTDLVAEAFGVKADPETVTVTTVPYGFGSPATAGLYRVTDGSGAWSLFAKQLHHVRHWPALVYIPEVFRQSFADEFPWRTEIELWDPRIQASMPEGLRSPVLHRLVDLPDDRLTLWQEDIREAGTPWDLERFALAAYRIGRWNARSMSEEVKAVSGFRPGHGLRMYAERAVTFRGLEPLRDDQLWSHPWLAGHADVRESLLALGPRIGEMLDRLDALPQALPHGDASPQNLLVTADSDDFVVIDLSFRTPHALGFDLGQLLIGLVHADILPAAELPAVRDAIVPAYVRGLTDEGVDGMADIAREGFTKSVLLRSGFDGIRYELLGDGTDEARATVTQRLEMSRFLIGQVQDLT